ncbi:hypothetical protein BH09VER1_BH09VER1_29540 [soil metagenome]
MGKSWAGWSTIPLFWRFQLVGWSAYIVLSFPLKVIFLGTVQAAVVTTLVRDGFAFLLTLGMRAIYWRTYALHRRLPWVAVIVVAASLSAGLLLTLFSLALEHVIVLEETVLFGELNDIRLFYFCTSLYVAWSLLYFGIKFMGDAAERDLLLAYAETARRDSELKMLRAQMDPHFLFNALNAIRAGIDQRSRELIAIVEGLSGYLRYSLAHRNDNLVAVREEFDALVDYLTVEKARFREELEVSYHIDEAARPLLVPGVILQPLVENAIKYGRKTSPLPLRVQIGVEVANGQIELSVANTGSWDESPPSEPSHGLALQNLRDRLAILYPGNQTFQATANDGWVRVILRIPMERKL